MITIRLQEFILLIGCLQFLLPVNLAETQFPCYSTEKTPQRSRRHGTRGTTIGYHLQPQHHHPGNLFLAAVYLILKSGGCRLFSSCLGIFAICAVGVGIFPEYTGSTHLFFALLAFFFGSLAVLFSYRLGLNIPMVTVSLIMGLIALLTLLLAFILGNGNTNPLIAYLGVGGTEKFVVYPVLFYLTALGGYLTSRGKEWVRIRFTDG